MIPNFSAICEGIYKVPDALCVVQMGFAGSLDSLIKGWGSRVAKKKTGGLPKRFWRKENSEKFCQWKSPNKSEERGSGKRGDRGARTLFVQLSL